MKNILSLLLATTMFLFSFSQNEEENFEMEKSFKKNREHMMRDFTPEQITTLRLKKMTLALDLSEKQQQEIKPLLEKQVIDQRANKENKKDQIKDLSSEERYQMMNDRLDKQIAFKYEMKNILDKDQYELWSKKLITMKNELGKKKIRKRKKRHKKGQE